MACSIEIIPVGLRPIWLSRLTNVFRFGPDRVATFAVCSFADTAVRDVTVVCPFERGAGCDVSGVSVTRIVSSAVGHGDRRNLHILPNYNRSSALVDDHTRGSVRPHAQFPDFGQ